jgi:transcriptional regulator with PAS, ATPase and Fis domain
MSFLKNLAQISKAHIEQSIESGGQPVERKPVEEISQHKLGQIADHERQDVRNRLRELGAEKLVDSFNMLPPKSLDLLNNFITEDAKMLELKSLVRLLALRNDPVLIHGESGTGKEIIASSLHGHRKGLFLAVNTTSLPDNLLESELFGHVKGSFTGADKDRVGKLEAAANGTIFLDEIGDMKPNMQEKLLRALQEKVITPVGSNEERPINCRVIAATHKVIRQEIVTKQLCERNMHEVFGNGKSVCLYCGGIMENVGALCTHRPVIHEVKWHPSFREDLYWRIATFELHITPLRERRDDIREILDHKFDPTFKLTEEERDYLETLPLTGNVRELHARVQRMILEKELQPKQLKLLTT